MLQPWIAVGKIVAELTYPRIELKISSSTHSRVSVGPTAQNTSTVNTVNTSKNDKNEFKHLLEFSMTDVRLVFSLFFSQK